jgi:hypothetical protein
MTTLLLKSIEETQSFFIREIWWAFLWFIFLPKRITLCSVKTSIHNAYQFNSNTDKKFDYLVQNIEFAHWRFKLCDKNGKNDLVEVKTIYTRTLRCFPRILPQPFEIKLQKCFPVYTLFFFRIQRVNRGRTKLGRCLCHAVPTIIPCDNPFKDHRQLRGA